MARQTRCDLALLLCNGTTYALPRGRRSTRRAVWNLADPRQVLDLDVVVAAGTIVSGAELVAGTLVECELDGARVLVPRHLIEEMS